MPNRLIKESLCSSAQIDALSAFEETVFIRLIVNVDDYGRIDARVAYLKSKLFVTKEGITNKSIADAVSKLETVGLVKCYEVDEKPFLLLPNWHKHQRIRNTKEKFPPPPEGYFADLRKIAENCGDLPQKVALIQSNPIQSESNPNTNPNISTERSDDRPVPEVVFISLPLNDGSLFPVNERDVENYKGLYPIVDVEQELRNMLGWLEANPAKKKTKSGIKRFITGWLSRTQDKGGTAAKHSQTKQEGNSLGWGKLTSANDMWDEYEQEQQQKGAAQ